LTEPTTRRSRNTVRSTLGLGVTVTIMRVRHRFRRSATGPGGRRACRCR
jgi:hypothetical protein